MKFVLELLVPFLGSKLVGQLLSGPKQCGTRRPEVLGNVAHGQHRSLQQRQKLTARTTGGIYLRWGLRYASREIPRLENRPCVVSPTGVSIPTRFP